MKKLRRILGLMLAAAMLLAASVQVYAADGTEPSASDYKTVYVYNIEQDVTVKAYQIIDATYDSKGNGLTGYVVADGLSIEDLESPTAEEITDIASDIYDGIITALEEKTLSYDASSGAYYADLEAGMWIILVWDSNAVIYNPMIVSNWYTDANLASSLTAGSVDAYGNFIEGEWTDEEDVASRTYETVETVYAKHDTVSVDKEITNYSSDDSHTQDSSSGADYNIGDEVSFKITTRIPDYSDAYINAENITTFTVVDTLSSGLDAIEKSDISVTVGGEEIPESETSASSGLVTYNYQVTLTDNSDGSQTIEIAFVEDFIDSHPNNSVVIEYSTVLNSSALTVGDTSADYNSNEVDIIYSNNPTTTISTEDIGGGKKVYIYTFSITNEIVKVSPEGTASADGNTVTAVNALADAQFTIYTDEACTQVYTNDYNTSGVSASDENGYVAFTGLEEGTYYITETEAPDDYMINDTVYKIVIAAEYDETEGSASEGMLTSYSITVTDLTTLSTYTNEYEFDYTTAQKTYEASDGETVYTWYEVESVSVSASQNPAAIVDSDLIKLPSTGGMGIYAVTAVSVLIAGLGAFLALRKKKERDETA